MHSALQRNTWWPSNRTRVLAPSILPSITTQFEPIRTAYSALYRRAWLPLCILVCGPICFMLCGLMCCHGYTGSAEHAMTPLCIYVMWPDVIWCACGLICMMVCAPMRIMECGSIPPFIATPGSRGAICFFCVALVRIVFENSLCAGLVPPPCGLPFMLPVCWLSAACVLLLC